MNPTTDPLRSPASDVPPIHIWAIVLNWNRCADTLACLRSLAASNCPGIALTLLVVDNGSTDGTLAAVAEALPAVRCLALAENMGYARGINAGLDLALGEGAEWTFLVNNDAVVAADTLATLLGATADPAVGMATPTIYFFDEPETVWPSAGWRRRLTLAGFDTTAAPPSDRPYDVDWATGCGLLVRRAVWAEVGLLDAGFFVYYEDHDFCLRAKAEGWRILHVPAARMWHKVSASSGGVGSPAQSYALARSSVRYFLRHTHGWHRAFICAYRAASLLHTVSNAVLSRRPSSALAYARGLLDGWRDVRRDGLGVLLERADSTSRRD